MPNDATASCSEPAAASIKTGGGTAGRASAVEKRKWSEVDRSGGSSQGLRAGSGIYIPLYSHYGIHPIYTNMRQNNFCYMKAHF